MKIAIVSTENDDLLTAEAREFLPQLLEGLIDNGCEVRLFTHDAPSGDAVDQLAQANPLLQRSIWQVRGAIDDAARDSARWLGEFEMDVYLIWNGDAAAWAVLPLLNPRIATVAVGHADAEIFYAPARHYRSFLTRVIGTTPETCVGFVINCVIDKERVEWISHDEAAAGDAENLSKIIDTYRLCFEKAIADADAAPREITEDFTPLSSKQSAPSSWFERLRSKFMN